jgi:hypothetical protein
MAKRQSQNPDASETVIDEATLKLALNRGACSDARDCLGKAWRDISLEHAKWAARNLPLPDGIAEYLHERTGIRSHWREGKRHRDDGPAFEGADGSKVWYREGKRHRDDGPAFEWADGSKVWYREGKLHREDGPAVEWADGSKVWYREGKRHRDDGPAVEGADGSKEWWREDKLHRDDGPAVEWADGSKEWYREGKRQPSPVFGEAADG